MIEYTIQKCKEMPVPKKHRHRVYAVCTDKRGRIVGEAENSYTKTHPWQQELGALTGNDELSCLHAEVAALLKSRGKAVNIYIARVGRSGKPLAAAPCVACSLAIKLMNIKNVFFTKTEEEPS